MFSIIIPLYNKKDYIEKAIRSVLSQLCKDYELIVIDDGSTDGGAEIAAKLCGEIKNSQLIRQQNAGVSTARNHGVRIAKYDYVAFLDADDWWEPDYLFKMRKLIEDYPDAGIYASGYYIVKNGSKRIAAIGVDETFDQGPINYFQVYAKTLIMPVWTGAVVLKKSVFEYFRGFNPGLKLGEDFDLWIRISLKSPVVFLNEPLSNYNQDVIQESRAIGEKFYKPEEHILFSDFGNVDDPDFVILFEKLALYGLLPYHVAGKNTKEINLILKKISWNKHSFKYHLFYKILPVKIVYFWLLFMKFGSRMKTLLANTIKTHESN